MLRLVFRPLLILLTLAALLVALVQVAGRITFNLLDGLEGTVNGVLAARDIRVSGLSGDWRMLNPVVRIERIRLPAGRIDDVTAELDMVESVLRGLPLLRRLEVGDLDLALHKADGEPWRLAGAMPAGDFDALPLLRHSDQLRASGLLRLHRDGLPPAEIGVAYLGINRGGEHRHRVELENRGEDCVQPPDCRARVDLFSQAALWPLRPQSMRVRAGADGFLLPRALVGIPALRLTRLDGAWHLADEDSRGSLSLRAEQVAGADEDRLALALDAAARGRSGRQRGAVRSWQVARGEDVWELPRLRFDATGEVLWAHMPELDLARVTDFLKQALTGIEPAERWLAALNPRGRAHDLHAFADLDEGGFGYAMTLEDVAIDDYKGSPRVRGGAGRLIGTGRSIQFDVNAEDMGLAFPDLFRDGWELPYAQGSLQTWIGPDYFGLRGLNLRAETLGARAAGGFALSRPPDREGQRLTLVVSTDRLDVAAAQRFVSYKLDDGLRAWLETAPRSGVLRNGTVAYQGQFSEEPGELGRRFELLARVEQGALRYHPDWPLVTELDGMLAVAGSSVEADVESARSADARVNASHVRVVSGAADVSLDADLDGAALLELARTTPLADWLQFVEPDWQASGPLRVSGELSVPLATDTEVAPAVRLRADLEGVDVALPGYRVALEALTGNVRYRFPSYVDASGVQGRMFGAPVSIGARTESDGDTVHLQFSGVAGAADVWRLTGLRDPGLLAGTLPFEADLGIAVESGLDTELVLSSPLTGLAVELPAGLGKSADGARTAEFRLVFGETVFGLDFAYGDAGGWLEFDQQPLRGALAFGGARHPPRHAVTAPELHVVGRLDGFDLEQVLSAGGAGGPDGAGTGLSLPVRLLDLRVGEIGIADFTLHDAVLSGTIAADDLAVTVRSRELGGRLAQSGAAPLAIDLERLQVPVEAGPGVEGADPLDAAIIGDLPVADVRIGRLLLGDAEYGAWQFKMRPESGNTLRIDDLDATIRGVTITGSDSLIWDGAADRTRFVGALDGGDLAQTLPQWGYAASIETESAELSGEFSWPGSPLAVDLLRLQGNATARALEGRFLDVEAGSGSQRIFSLLNFANIAKRLSLNFSDVFGKGVSFDEIQAHFALDDGLLTFLEPMEVKGTGSRFRVTGSVNIDSGELDNDMVVTLPVSQSLPWYAAYVALANPLAGLGVLVGERMLRKPLEQFSSARYHIGGTLDEPEVEFVSVFGTEPLGSSAGNAGGAAEDGAAADGEQGSAPTDGATDGDGEDAAAPEQQELSESP